MSATDFAGALAEQQQREISNELLSMIDVLAQTLDRISYDPTLDEKDAVIEKISGKLTTTISKAASASQGTSKTPAGKNREAPSSSRQEIHENISKLAASRSEKTGESPERAYSEILKTDVGRQFRAACQSAESAEPYSQGADQDSDEGGSFAYGVLRKQSEEFAEKHGVTFEKAMREVSGSRRGRMLVSKHREALSS